MPDDSVPATIAAPPAGTPDTIGAMTPPQPPPASSAADILAALQAPGQQQPEAPDSPQASYYIPQVSQPEYQPLPHAEDHHSMMGRIMDRVATILGGDETYRIHKDTDGNVSVEKDPSTRTEKWGRIAAAALGGAAKGMAVGQGPGGAARAASAGFQQGMQMPQQQKDNLQKDVTAQQQAMLFKANMASLNQKVAIGALSLKGAGIKFASDVAGMLNEQSEHAANAPGTVDFGVTETPQDAYQLHKTKPDLFAAHPQGKVVTYPEVNGKGEVLGFHSYLVDPAWMNQRNDKPLPAFGMVYNSTTKQYEPKQVGTIAVGGTSNGDYALQTMDFATKSSTIAKNYADADKAEKDKPATDPKTLDEAIIAYNKNPTPQMKASIDQMQQSAEAKARAGKSPGGTAVFLPDGKGGYTAEKVQPGQSVPAGAVTAGGMNTLNVNSAPLNAPPVAPGNYEPGFAPAQNFARGTPGINPKQIGKVPADAAKAGRLGRNVISNGEQIIRVLNDHPELVGRINSLGSKWQNVIGLKDDDPLAELNAYVDQMTVANLGAHNLRSTPLVIRQEEAATNKLKNDPSSIKAFVTARMHSAQNFVNEDKRYRLYGDPDGPDQKLANQGAAVQPPATNAGAPLADRLNQALGH
jgi:hypothetical protein